MKDDNNNIRKYAVFTGLGLQIGAAIYLGAYLGGLIDEKYQMEKPIFRLILILLFFVGSMYVLLKTLKKMEE